MITNKVGVNKNHRLSPGVYKFRSPGRTKKTDKLVSCPYCGRVDVVRHTHRNGMCVDCGKIYENFRKLEPSSLRYQEYAQHYELMRSKGLRTPEYKLEEVTIVTEKVCKQCGQEKSVDNYRKNAARGKGIYNTTQGYHNFCKECESINSRAITLEKDPNKDQKTYNLLVDYYRSLEEAGLGIMSAVAGRYLGKDKPERGGEASSLESKLLQAISTNRGDELQVHINKLRSKLYDTIDEASEVQDALRVKLKAAGLYDEADKLLEDWEYEE